MKLTEFEEIQLYVSINRGPNVCLYEDQDQVDLDASSPID